jgi:hypothetical protein
MSTAEDSEGRITYSGQVLKVWVIVPSDESRVGDTGSACCGRSQLF